MSAPLVATRSAPRSYWTGVRQICLPVATSMAKVQLPFTTYMTPL